MKDTVVFLLATLLLFAATEAYGQAPRRMLQGGACLHRDCLPIQGLRLSDEQRQAIQDIELAYSDRMNGIQNRLLGKRLELQTVFADPGADEESIRSKALEVSQLDAQYWEIMLEYQLAIRARLTPEQLRAWCASAESCLTKGGTGKP